MFGILQLLPVLLAGDTIPTDNAGAWRLIYESPLGKRSEPLMGDLGNALADQASPRDRQRLFPNGRAMIEGGYLLLQHKSTGSGQNHDSDKVIVEIPITVHEKASGLKTPRTLLYTNRDTPRIADDPASGNKVFVDVMAFLVPAGQIWELGSNEQPFLRLKTSSVA